MYINLNIPLNNIRDSVPVCEEIPLVVDLDGTLVKGDMLLEGIFYLLRANPLNCFMLVMWLIRGKAYLKQQVALRFEFDPARLQYQQIFLSYVKSQAGKRRPLYLATASDRQSANRIAEHLGMFEKVLASDGHNNLTGSRKLQAILNAVPGGCFDYAGNALVDLPIWQRARRAIVVNPEMGVERLARRRAQVVEVFDDRDRGWSMYLKAVRIHQWLKNLLVGVPFITAHLWENDTALFDVFIAFIAFGLCASGTYLINDLLDLQADREHPRKSRRPLARGDLSLRAGILLLVGLLVAGLALANFLSLHFFLVLVGYLVLTLSYSLFFKSFILVDVMMLAGLYAMRIMAGAVAVQVPISSWLIAFSMFLFLSLALVKRCSELKTIEKKNKKKTSGRDYRLADFQALLCMGVASGYLSVLVLVLFIEDVARHAEYGSPRRLWLLCPPMFYWVSRLWIKTVRGEMHDDPLVYSLQDRTSWLAFAAMIVIAIQAL